MKNPPNRDNPRRLTTQEVEAALYAALRDEGRLFPKTEEDVAALEESLDLTGVPTPDVNGFMAKLRESCESKIVQPVRPEKTPQTVIRLLKNSFSTKFSCANPNDFEG
jgi:hypothetical protein